MKRLAWCACVVLLVSACNGGSTGGGSSAAGGRSLVALLHSVPDTAENRGEPVLYGSLDRLRGGNHPGSAEDDMHLLTTSSSFSFFLPSDMRTSVMRPEFAEFAGFDTRAVEASIEFGLLPDSGAVFVGTMKAGNIEKGLRSSPGGDALQTEKADGVSYFSLGEDGVTDIAAVSAIRRIGQPLRMALAGNTLYWSRSRTVVDACVAARSGTSLADDPGYLAVATALDRAKVVNGIVVSPQAGEPWSVGGLGETFRGDASTLTVVLQYSDAALAASAAPAFRAHVEHDASLLTKGPWGDLLTVTDVRAEGTTMVATLSSVKPGIATTVVFARDNLLQF